MNDESKSARERCMVKGELCTVDFLTLRLHV